MSRLSRRQQLLCGIVVVHLVGAMGMLLALQGWRSRSVNFDLVPHVQSAQAFLAHGQLPDRGCLNGFASFIPPGTTWLFLPGVFVFNDPRLFEVLGSGLLFLGTLLGIFVLAYDCWGLRCALLAVGLYGLSELGLHFAGSLWPRGHPCFYVWMLYWTGRWIRCREAKYLTAALITWAAGMYVFLEIAPALAILPVLWWRHRPPVRLRSLAVGAGVTVVIWYPYLAFEAERGFVDLRSQVQQQEILPAQYQQAWCDPTLTLLREWGETSDVPEHTAHSLWHRLRLRGKAIFWGLPYNFERVARVPSASLVLLLAVSSLAMLSLSPVSPTRGPRRWRPWLTSLALGLMLVGVLANEVVLARLLSADGHLELSTGEHLRLWQGVLGLTGLALFMQSRQWGTKHGSLPRRAGMATESEPSGQRAQVLVLSLLIPWCILLLLAEPNPYPLGGERRFWWLWPLEVIMLAAFVTHVLPRWGAFRPITWTVQTGLILIVLGNPLALSSVESWLRTGWSGLDAPEIQTVDYIAEQLHGLGKRHAAIGYQTLYMALPAFNFFMAEFHIVDARYKVGADFDLLFTSRHAIVNTNHCAEGIAPDDEYRIVQSSTVWTISKYAGLALDRRFQLQQQFGPYQVFKRN
jgi:hypothetical protein